MRTAIYSLILGIGSLACIPPSAAQDKEWTDLFRNGLRDWSRTGTGDTPWRFTSGGGLMCEGGSEMYLPDREFSDGTLKLEFRFKPTSAKTGYKANVWVRRTLNRGAGCKVALGDNCGLLTGYFQGSSDAVKEVEDKPLAKAAKPIGEWNQVTIKLEARTALVHINDKEVSAFSKCDSTGGMIALEADGSTVEFRNVMWKDGK